LAGDASGSEWRAAAPVDKREGRSDLELQDVLRRRKMVRSFRADPVPADAVDAVVASVLHAPSAGFTQGNEFLVLESRDAVDDYFRLTDDPSDPFSPEARAVLPPVVVLPLSNRSAYLERYSEPDKIAFGLDDAAHWPVPYWDVDAAMASMLILLTAIECGLGALFTGIFFGESAMLERFGVPDRFRPIGAIHLGYPTEIDEFAPKSSVVSRRRRGVDQLVHHNRW
jgi:nitroreductase